MCEQPANQTGKWSYHCVTGTQERESTALEVINAFRSNEIYRATSLWFRVISP